MKLADSAPRARLRHILSEPSSPFREGCVLATIEDILSREGIPCFRDPAQNLVVGVKSKAEYVKLLRMKSPEPVRIFIAHMDHPGFHGLEWNDEAGDGELLSFKWHG
jgi:endoglucanase